MWNWPIEVGGANGSIAVTEQDRKKNRAQEAPRDISCSQGKRTEAKRPKEFVLINQFEEMIYGQKLP